MVDRQFVGSLAGWTFLTTVCVTATTLLAPGGTTLVSLFVGFSNTLAADASGVAARVVGPLGTAFTAVVFTLVLVVPVAVAGYRVRRGDDALATAGLLVAALATLPGVPVALVVFGATSAVAVAVLAVVTLLVAVYRLDRDPGVTGRSFTSMQFAHVGLVLVLLAGTVVGTALGLGVQATAVDSSQLGAPQVNFEANYTATDETHGIVTITHSGGERVPAARLKLVSDEFAAVSGVDQTTSGPWQGSVSGADDAVVPGDSVTVGVTGDCTVRVVYEYQGTMNTIGIARCAELR